MEESANLTPEMTQRIAYSVMSEKHRKTLEESGQVDFSFGVKDIGRYRAHVFMQRGSVAAAFRRLPLKIMNVKELGLTEREGMVGIEEKEDSSERQWVGSGV